MAQSNLPLRDDTSGDDSLNLTFLIVGAGPAGATLGCYLGKYGTFNYTLFPTKNTSKWYM